MADKDVQSVTPEESVRLGGLLTFLMRHFVALAGTSIDLDDNGHPVGTPRFFACSGFIMRLLGRWFYVTAGHVLRDLRSPKVRVEGCRFVDYLGPDAKVTLPTPFDLDGQETFFICDDRFGLDFALIPLSALYRAGFEVNGIVAVGEENWISQHELEFESFVLVGLPRELHRPYPGGHGIEPVMMTVKRVGQLPSDVDVPTPDIPRFIGRLPMTIEIPDIEGMSGGPIIGFKQLPNGQWAYWVVALQSGWLKSHRIILGCSVVEFASRTVAFLLEATEGE